MITNQALARLDAPVDAARRDLAAAQAAARAVPAKIPLAEHNPAMVKLDTETKLITHAIRMAACNTETILARALNTCYARAGDEAYALIREALHASGDITIHGSTCTSAWTRYRHPAAPAPWPPSANSSPPPQPATPEPSSSCTTKSKNIPALHELLRYVRSPGAIRARASSPRLRSRKAGNCLTGRRNSMLR